MPSIRTALGLAFSCGVAAASGADVLTNHNNIARTGLVSDEKHLTPATVSQLKVLYQNTVDGQVYAQPLCVSNQAINGGKNHRNLVIVATEHGSVYAFGAGSGKTYWHVSLISPGYMPVQYNDPEINCTDLQPEISITATPVIDRTAGTNGRIFVVAMETDGQEHFDCKLHALDLATGKDAIPPMVIAASVTGEGPATTFVPQSERSRSALLLAHGVIYIAFASFCDDPPYSGWLLGYRESDLSQVAVFNDNPNGSPADGDLPDGSGGGIWQAGLGPACDAQGNIYVAVGNGPFDETLTDSGFPANQDYGDSVLKLTPTSTLPGLTVSDYFTPYNEGQEAQFDRDLGSGGVVILPPITDTNGNAHNLMMNGDKAANVYVLDQSNLGKFNATQNNNYQELAGAMPLGVFSSPAYFNGSVYYGCSGMPMQRFVFDYTNPDKPILNPTPVAQGAKALGYPDCTPSISSDGKNNGVVWAYEYSTSNAILHAFDAVTLTELYNSSGVTIGPGVKFAVPTVFHGKVYLGTSNSLVIFGL